MSKLNKYFCTKNLTSVLKDLSETQRSFFIIKDNQDSNVAIRYMNSTLNNANISAKITKIEFIYDKEIVTGLLVEVK